MKNVIRSLDGETCFDTDELSALFTLYKVRSRFGVFLIAFCYHMGEKSVCCNKNIQKIKARTSEIA